MRKRLDTTGGSGYSFAPNEGTISMQYHIARNGQQAGVFNEEEVRARLLRNEFSPTDLCWTEGMADWQPLSVRFAQTEPTLSSGDVINPYAPPQAGITVNRLSGSLELASLGDRLVAAILDAGVGVTCVIPMMVGWFIGDHNDQPPSPLALGLIGVSGLLLIGLTIYNLVLLATRGQTIGKKLKGIRIVTFPDGANPGGVKTILLRGFVNGLISGVPYLGTVYALVDICFIFREDRRCIHDLIAGTQVVKGQPPGF